MSHLTATQREHLRELLAAHRRQLRNDIREELLRNDSEQFTELAGQVHDSGEEAVADMQMELNAAVLGQSIRSLREVEAALQRIDGEGYGQCIDCGEAIPYARLEAYPSAQRCLAHQAEYEAH